MIRSIRSHLNSRPQGEYYGARGVAGGTSRLFTAASSQLAKSNALGAAMDYPFSLSVWFNALDLTARCIWSCTNFSSDTEYFAIFTDGAGHVYFEARGSGTLVDATSLGTYVAGTWNQVTIVATSAVSRKIFLNGISVSSTTSVTPSGLSVFTVGALIRLSTTDTFWNGSIGEVCVWKSALRDSDAGFLNTPLDINGAIGYPPSSLVMPSEVIGYWPMFGTSGSSLEATQGGGPTYNLSLSVSPPTASTLRPPIVYPPIQWEAGS